MVENLFSSRRILKKEGDVFLRPHIFEIYNKEGKLIKTGGFDGRFSTIDFEIIDKCDAIAYFNNKSDSVQNEENGVSKQNNTENKIGGSKGCHQNRRSKSESSDINAVSHKQIGNATSLSEYLKGEAEMRVEDLKTLSKENIESLKKKIGIISKRDFIGEKVLA